MAAFEYHALAADGRKKKGIIAADTIRQVRQQLRDQGLIPMDVMPAFWADPETNETPHHNGLWSLSKVQHDVD